MPKDWFTYIILTSDESLYTGITTDVLRRWSEHLACFQENKSKGAKYFRGRSPKKLVYVEQSYDRSTATKREIMIKKLTRQSKLALMKSESNQLYKYTELKELYE